MKIVTDTQPAHVAHRLNTLFDQLEHATPRGIGALSRSDLPYALHIDSEGWCMPLNRGYSPIGEPERRYCDYSDSKYENLRFPSYLLDAPIDGAVVYLTTSVVYGGLRYKGARDEYLRGCRRILWLLLGEFEMKLAA